MKLKVEFVNGKTTTLQGVVKYQPIEGEDTMDFTQAVNAMKAGNKVKRLRWLNNGFLTVNPNELGSHINYYRDGNDNPPTKWTPVLDDLMADDWWIVV